MFVLKLNPYSMGAYLPVEIVSCFFKIYQKGHPTVETGDLFFCYRTKSSVLKSTAKISNEGKSKEKRKEGEGREEREEETC